MPQTGELGVSFACPLNFLQDFLVGFPSLFCGSFLKAFLWKCPQDPCHYQIGHYPFLHHSDEWHHWSQNPLPSETKYLTYSTRIINIYFNKLHFACTKTTYMKTFKHLFQLKFDRLSKNIKSLRQGNPRHNTSSWS